MDGSEDEYQDFEDVEGTFVRLNEKFDNVQQNVEFCYKQHEKDQARV